MDGPGAVDRPGLGGIVPVGEPGVPPRGGPAGAPVCPEPGVPPRGGPAGAPDCPKPDELPLPVEKPRDPWAAALDAKVTTTAKTVTAATRFITPPNYTL